MIVTEFRFASDDGAQRFKSATINYVFQPEDDAADEAGPEIFKIEPEGKWLIERTEAPASDDPDPPPSPKLAQPGILNRRYSTVFHALGALVSTGVSTKLLTMPRKAKSSLL